MKLSPINIFKIKELSFIILYWLIMVRFVVALEYFGFDSNGLVKIRVGCF